MLCKKQAKRILKGSDCVNRILKGSDYVPTVDCTQDIILFL